MIYTCKPSKVSIYINKQKKSTAQIKEETGCTALINGGLFDMSTFQPVCHLKADGKVLSKDQWKYWGFGWNVNELELVSDYTAYENYIACVCLVRDGKAEPLSYPADMGGYRQRTAIGVFDDGRVWLYAVTSPVRTPECLQKFAIQAGVKHCVMLDGGGSTQGADPTETINAGRKVHNYICVWEEGEAMNRQPVYYMQTDSRWKDVDYSAPGEKTTIEKAGCGPTCAAMLIETLTGKTFTPVDACKWALNKGYKALNQGTYYSYFVPQFEAHGLSCERLNTSNIYGDKDSSVHKKAFDLLKRGYYLIACMGEGLWTSNGHYVVVWWEDGFVRINDPASKASVRLYGDTKTFKEQVKYYWAIDAREHNKRSDTVNIEVPILKQGSKGASVKALQQLLNAKGYNCGNVDGDFGAKTTAALKKYQKAVNLTVDGYCGFNTWTALLTK